MKPEELLKVAMNARELSYSPYSNFKVGAVVETKDGQTFLGTNIENVSYGLTMCAERTALYNAYLSGIKKDDIVSLTVVGDTDDVCYPCGACRQVMSELMNKDTKVYICNTKGKIVETTVEQLLPGSFELK